MTFSLQILIKLDVLKISCYVSNGYEMLLKQCYIPISYNDIIINRLNKFITILGYPYERLSACAFMHSITCIQFR